MDTNSPFTIKLPAKTEIYNCSWYTKGVRDSCPNPDQLLNSYDGQIVVDALSMKATFYSPRVAECDDAVKNPGCKLEAHLASDTLEKLSVNDSSFRKYLESLEINVKGNGGAVPHNLGTTQDSQDLKKDGFFDLMIQNGPTVLGIIVVAIFGCIVIPKVYSKVTGSSRRSSRRTIIQEQPLASTSRGSLPSVQALKSVISEEIQRQLFPFHKELKNLRSQVERLESKLETIGLSQELHASVAKSRGLFSEPISQQVSLNTPVPIQPVTPMAPSPPALLSVDLIKRAVASGDYTLISMHPHLFLSETLDSQKGLGEVKCFSIDGDQSQASSKTQSEFIAISFYDDTYLIPNIVPNATDPARTLKRHADRNNIYRNGQGGNFLIIDHLAVVQRNGDRFDLKKPGQIV